MAATEVQITVNVTTVTAAAIPKDSVGFACQLPHRTGSTGSVFVVVLCGKQDNVTHTTVV